MKSVSIHSRVLVLALGTSLLCISCREAEKPEAKVRPAVESVALVAGQPITPEQLEQALKRRFANPRRQPATEQKLEALEDLIRAEALYAKAQAAGFDRTPEIEARIKNLIVTAFKESRFQPAAPSITDQEIQQYYQANQSRFAIGAAIRAAIIHIRVPANAAPEKAEESRLYAERVLGEAKASRSDMAFAEVVRRHSEDQATRYRSGEIGWLERDTDKLEHDAVEALFSLTRPGDFAPLVRTSRGFVIAKLLEKREAGCKPVAEVKEAIRNQLWREKQTQAEADFYASIKQGLDVVINHRLLESLTLPVQKNEPPKLAAQARQ